MEMMERLMDILCCPVCRGGLNLKVSMKKGEDIVEGALVCGKCEHEYPISDGIPDLLPPEKFEK
jgi:uncharacterized protein YbaR (Trm112 family)